MPPLFRRPRQQVAGDSGERSPARKLSGNTWPLLGAIEQTRVLIVVNSAGEIGQLRDEGLPAIRVIVPPDLSGRLFQDDLDPGDVVFDSNLTPMLVWHERYPVGRGWRTGWVLSFDTDGQGNPDDYIVGLSLSDLDAAVAQAREYLRAAGYPLGGWRRS
jgi:hypothetical protein